MSRERSSSADMLVFFIKQMLSLKQAILGRREPHQLAWGLALGLLLGIVPHGNLIALAILLFIMSVKVNHGMVAVTAVATTFLATGLDPQSHAVGEYLLTHPDFAQLFVSLWQLPVVPWTDINNTVMVGSLTIGLAALLPTYLCAYPVFHWLAPELSDVPTDTTPPQASVARTASTATGTVPPPAIKVFAAESLNAPLCAMATDPSRADDIIDPATIGPVFYPLSEVETQAIDAAFGEAVAAEEMAQRTIVDTRIEVVRMYPLASSQSAEGSTAGDEMSLSDLEQAARASTDQDPPMSEALNYLLRQLRDARQGRAA